MPRLPVLQVPQLSLPELNGEGFVLRGWRHTTPDIDAVLRAAHDPDISQYSTVGSATTPLRAAQWIASHTAPDRLDWAITRKGDVMGRVSLAHIDTTDGIAEVGYWLLPENRGRGIASAAVGAVEYHAFGSLGVARLMICHEPPNVRSCLLAERRGYLAEGTLRSVFVRDGVRRDLHVHARLATDPPVR
jgi:RimJ/RimL family protein N-acetyltransferase